MTHPQHDLEEGQIAYDVTKQSLVEVTNTDAGTVGSQEAAMRDLILHAEGNQAVGFDDHTVCLEVEYLAIDGSSRAYTIPHTRISRSEELVGEVVRLTREAGVINELRDSLQPSSDATDE